MIQDLKYAVRSIWRSPLFAAGAVITLALGIGANTAMITLLNVTLFKPAPGADPDRLVWVTPTAGYSQRFQNVSYPEYREYQEAGRVFSGVLAFSRVKLALGGDAPERLQGLIVSGTYFDVLGIRASRGRTFRPDEDAEPDGHPVAVIGDGLWKRRFGSDPAAVGSTIIVNGHPFTVVGIAPPGFNGIELDDEPVAVWVPLAMARTILPGTPGILSDPDAGWLRVIARLAPNTSIAQAQAAARPIAARHQDSSAPGTRDLAVLPVKGGLDPSNRAELLPVLALLALVPMLVLTVACANGANLLLARAAPRRREIAVRAALGASRRRLVRQLLIESTLLSLAAGVAGVLLSFWMIDLVSVIARVPEAFASALTPDGRVLAATTLIAAATGVIFGMAPALAATRAALVPALMDQGISFHFAGRRHRLRDGMVVCQVAISLVLLVIAGLFLRSLGKALAVDPGFQPRGVIAMSIDPALHGYAPAARAAFQDRLLEAVRAVPGVVSAGTITDVPLSGRMIGDEVSADASGADAGVRIHYAGIGHGYFATMGIALVRGRDFTPADADTAIVNETLSRRLWGEADPIGRHVSFTGRARRYEIVGVARDGKYDSLTDGRSAFLYVPHRQFQLSTEFSLVARVSTGPAPAIASLKAAVQRLDPNLPVFGVTTLDAMLAGNLDKQRAASALVGTFGSLALLLAGLGVFGVMMHRVSSRTREIGIRMSLGARAEDIVVLVIGDGLRVSLVGIGIGLAASAGLSQLLAGFLFGLNAADASAFAAGAAVLMAMTLAASYIPARRAARVDPMVALRHQ